MKTSINAVCALSFCFALVLFSACDKNDESVAPVQNHDENEMMSLLHKMTQNMDTIKLWVNHGEDFARYMEVHHQYAIMMGNKVLDQGDDETIRFLAEDIVKFKQSQLPGLADFLKEHTPYWDAKGVIFDREAKAALDSMHARADRETLSGDVDHDFAVIIKHHNESAIDMAESYLPLGQNVTLRALAEQMILNATDNNKVIEAWLSKQER